MGGKSFLRSHLIAWGFKLMPAWLQSIDVPANVQQPATKVITELGRDVHSWLHGAKRPQYQQIAATAMLLALCLTHLLIFRVTEEFCSVSGFKTEYVGTYCQLQAFQIQESGIFSCGQENRKETLTWWWKWWSRGSWWWHIALAVVTR